jgi:transcriptional regulator with XRE-family HTH domain
VTEHLPSLLEQLRHEKGVAIGKVVAETGVTHKTIVRYERSPMYYPKAEIIRKLADYYGVEPAAILRSMRAQVRASEGSE